MVDVDDDELEEAWKESVRPSTPNKNGTSVDVSSPNTVLALPAELHSPQKYDIKPPPLQNVNGFRKTDDTSLSPALARHMTHSINGDPDSILPAMQRSPPRSHSDGSADQKQTLPPISTALSMDSATSPFSARSPNLMRGNTSTFGQTPSSYSNPSPFSIMSPPTSTNPALWRTNTSHSTPSDYAVTSASTRTSMSTPASSGPMPSPHTFPTPASAVADSSRRELIPESHTSPEEMVHDVNGVSNGNEVYVNGNFTCTIKGCTAASFQTQYLLNSHMNVHSDTRPHFCPVADCPRGPGGQGFKRKNEMIR